MSILGLGNIVRMCTSEDMLSARFMVSSDHFIASKHFPIHCLHSVEG